MTQSNISIHLEFLFAAAGNSFYENDEYLHARKCDVKPKLS